MSLLRYVAALLLLSVPLHRSWAEISGRFVPADASLLVELPPPPADDSPAGLADLETVLQVQAERTPAQVERAQRVEKHSAFLMGARVFGPWFTAENLPLTARFFKTAGSQFRPLLVQAKEKWERPRPYVRNDRVQPCLALPEGMSYPSGHSASAAVWAELFSAAFPERQGAFAAQVRETMWSRVLAGVHYPSDTQAGLLVGRTIGRAMLTQSTTREALAEVRAEIETFQQRLAAGGQTGETKP